MLGGKVPLLIELSVVDARLGVTTEDGGDGVAIDAVSGSDAFEVTLRSLRTCLLVI